MDQVRFSPIMSCACLFYSACCGTRDGSVEASRKAYVRADWCSRAIFCWATRLVCRASREEVQPEDLWELSERLKADATADKLRRAWVAEQARAAAKGAKPSLRRATMCAFWGSVFWILFWQMLWLAFVLVESGVVLRGLISELADANARTVSLDLSWLGVSDALTVPWVALVYAAFFSLFEFARSLATNRQWALAVRFGFEMRSAVRVLVYERSLELAAGECAVGDVVQLVTNDAARLAGAGQFGCFLVTGPISLLAILGVMLAVIGPASIAGLVVLVLLAPVATKFGKLVGRYRRSAVAATDEHVRAIDEILQGEFDTSPSFLRRLAMCSPWVDGHPPELTHALTSLLLCSSYQRTPTH